MPQINSTRHTLRHLRNNLPVRKRQYFEQKIINRIVRLNTFRNCQNLAIYLPFDGEVDTHPLISIAWDMHKSVYLPILTNKKLLRFAPYYRNSMLKPNRYKILEPVTPSNRIQSAKKMDLVIVPLVGFDQNCHRLGMGGGFYDRSFSFLLNRFNSHKPKLVGISFEIQKLSHIKSNSWDVDLNFIATEEKLYTR